MKLPSMREFKPDARRYILATGILSMSFMGFHILLKGLYMLRLGFDTEYLGVYYSLGAYSYMAMGLPSGALGKRWGTRPVMWIGSLLVVIGTGMLPLLEVMPRSWWQIAPVISQIIMTVGWSMFNVNMVPALRAVTDSNTCSSAFSMANAVREAGILIGNLVGGILPGAFALWLGQSTDDPAPYRWVLVLGAVAGMLALIPIGLTSSGHIGQAPNSRPKQRLDRRYILPVTLIMLYIFVRHSGWASSQSFSTIYMDDELRISTALIGNLNSIARIGAICASLMLPLLMQKRSHAWLLMMVTLGVAASLLVMGLVPTTWGAAIGNLGVVILTALWLPTLQVFQTHVFDENSQAVIYGASSMAMGLGYGTMSLGGGYFIAAYGYSKLFILGAGISVVSALILAVMLRSTAKLTPDTPVA